MSAGLSQMRRIMGRLAKGQVAMLLDGWHYNFRQSETEAFGELCTTMEDTLSEELQDILRARLVQMGGTLSEKTRESMLARLTPKRNEVNRSPSVNTDATIEVRNMITSQLKLTLERRKRG